MHIFRYLVLAFLFSSSFASADSWFDRKIEILESTPDISGWGFDVHFGQKPATHDVLGQSLLSPHLFNWYFSNYRIGIDYYSTQSTFFAPDFIRDFSVFLQSDGKLYKDILFTYTRLGIGQIYVDDLIYEDGILNIPFALGLELITGNTNKGVFSFFVQYRVNLFTYWDEEESLPQNANEVLLLKAIDGAIFSTGLRIHF